MRLVLLYEIIAVSILMVLLSFMIPVSGNSHVDIILIPATFLFGTIYGFEILVVLGNFSELKKLLASETAGLVFIYHMAHAIGGDFAKDMEARIEKYILTSIDYSLKYHVSSTDEDFISIAEPLKSFEVTNEKHGVTLEAIQKGFHQIVEARYQLGQVAPREIGLPEWTMLISLGAILILTLFLGREADIISRFSAGIFASTVIGVLLLLNETDSNHIQETRLEYEIFNQVLQDIGKQEYYPEFAIKKGLVKIPKKPYRIGIFSHYPHLTNREIQEVS